MFHREVAVGSEVVDEAVVGDAACLFQTRHALVDFDVYEAVDYYF